MSPQKENGFTPIANELFEAFYRCKLLEYERCVVMCVWRKTYGWSKKEDWISLSQMEIETGISKCNISRVITRLINKKIIQKNGFLKSINNYSNYARHATKKIFPLIWKLYKNVVCPPTSDFSTYQLEKDTDGRLSVSKVPHSTAQAIKRKHPP